MKEDRERKGQKGRLQERKESRGGDGRMQLIDEYTLTASPGDPVCLEREWRGWDALRMGVERERGVGGCLSTFFPSAPIIPLRLDQRQFGFLLVAASRPFSL